MLKYDLVYTSLADGSTLLCTERQLDISRQILGGLLRFCIYAYFLESSAWEAVCLFWIFVEICLAIACVDE